MKETSLFIIGAGLALLEIKDIVSSINQASYDEQYKVVGAFDDAAEELGKSVYGINILGKLEKAKAFAEENSEAVFAFGIGSLNTRCDRIQIFKALRIPKHRFVTLIHPTALISGSAKIGFGSIIHPFAIVSAGAVVDDFNIIAVRSTVGLNASLGEFSMICSHVLLLTDVQIGRAVFVGSSSVVMEKIKLEDFSVVGLSSLVSRNVKSSTWVIGTPAKIFKRD